LDIKIIYSYSDILPYLDEIKQQKIIAVDTETTGLDPREHKIRLVQLAWENAVLVIDCFSFLPQGLESLKAVLESSSVKVFQNAKFDLQFFMAIDIFPLHIFDTMLAGQLLSPFCGPKRFNLDALTEYYLNESVDKTLQKSDWGENLSTEQFQYAGKDVEIMLRLRTALVERLLQYGFVEVAQIEFECAIGIAQMEYHGIQLDRWEWRRLTEKTETDKKTALNNLHEFSGQPMVQMSLFGEDEVIDNNFESNPYVLSLLHKYEIPVANTSKAALAPYRLHPLVVALSEYRSASKKLSSFLYPIADAVHAITERLHPKYGQITAWSGRMSSYSPNIQQIPRAPEFRKCFTAPSGRKLLIADYSQIELRVAAQITQDKRMLEAYRNGEDLHSLTASLILQKPVGTVSKYERQYAKAVNFGLIYAMGANGLQQYAQLSYDVEMTLEQAEKFRSLFFQAYPGIKEWHDHLKKHQPETGQTISGRKFPFLKQYGLPAYCNTPVQGTAADILKKALGILATKLSGTDTYVVGTIHDEIILECAEDKAEHFGQLLKDTMVYASNSILKDVPSQADFAIADRWSEK
jgi:DNA polymerase-1